MLGGIRSPRLNFIKTPSFSRHQEDDNLALGYCLGEHKTARERTRNTDERMRWSNSGFGAFRSQTFPNHT